MVNNNLQYKYQNNSIGVLPLLLLPALELGSTLISLVLPFINFGGHSDYYYFDRSLQGQIDYIKVIQTAVKWAGDPNGLNTLNQPITLKESPNFKGLTRWEALSKLFKDQLLINDRNIQPELKAKLLQNLIALINYAVSIGKLPANNYINSLGQMAPEPAKINKIIKSGYFLPIVAGAAVLLYLKK
jgi:hypothetical protein